jgi:hypothetical protein
MGRGEPAGERIEDAQENKTLWIFCLPVGDGSNPVQIHSAGATTTDNMYCTYMLSIRNFAY